jgi:hypothetical protein
MCNLRLVVVALPLMLAALGASAESFLLPEVTTSPSGMLKKLFRGDVRMGRNGVPADPTFVARAKEPDHPVNPAELYIIDEYGFRYDGRGNRIR